MTILVFAGFYSFTNIDYEAGFSSFTDTVGCVERWRTESVPLVDMADTVIAMGQN